MKMQADTQINDILDHLVKHKTITSIQAYELYGATRLSAIIYRLRQEYKLTINTTRVKDKNRHGRGISYCVYELIGE